MKKRVRVSPEAMGALLAHDWPGNVRELRNVLERGAVVAQGDVIKPSDLGLAPAPARAPVPTPRVSRCPSRRSRSATSPRCSVTPGQREPGGEATRHRPCHALQQDPEVPAPPGRRGVRPFRELSTSRRGAENIDE